MTSKDHTPHVLILGGGIGGLTVAQALRKKGISFSIFERDPEQNSRNQGWSIGLHTILDDLKASIPDDMPSLETVFHLHPLKFPSQLAVYQAQDPSQRHGVTDDRAGKLLRANRRRLREFLSTGIQVEFAKQAAGIKEDDHSITVNFTDGTSANGDFLVGADGVHSIVRRHLLYPDEDKLKRLPIATIIGEVTLKNEDMERQLELGHSCYIVRADNNMTGSGDLVMFVGVNDVLPDAKSGLYYWFLIWPDEAATQGSHWTATASQQELLSIARAMTKNFAPDFKAIIEKTSVEGMRAPPLTMHDVELSPEDISSGRVALLGDAAHCMTPFSGQGGVTAIRDALDLARALSRVAEDGLRGADLQAVMAKYRDTMLERGVRAVQLSRDAITKSNLVREGAPFAYGQYSKPIPLEKIRL
ncbi:unnamed protein product [Alternaria alternata]